MGLVTSLVLGASVVLTPPALVRTATRAITTAAYHMIAYRMFFRSPAVPRARADADTQTCDDGAP